MAPQHPCKGPAKQRASTKPLLMSRTPSLRPAARRHLPPPAAITTLLAANARATAPPHAAGRPAAATLPLAHVAPSLALLPVGGARGSPNLLNKLFLLVLGLAKTHVLRVRCVSCLVHWAHPARPSDRFASEHSLIILRLPLQVHIEQQQIHVMPSPNLVSLVEDATSDLEKVVAEVVAELGTTPQLESIKQGLQGLRDLSRFLLRRSSASSSAQPAQPLREISACRASAARGAPQSRNVAGVIAGVAGGELPSFDQVRFSPVRLMFRKLVRGHLLIEEDNCSLPLATAAAKHFGQFVKSLKFRASEINDKDKDAHLVKC